MFHFYWAVSLLFEPHNTYHYWLVHTILTRSKIYAYAACAKILEDFHRIPKAFPVDPKRSIELW